MKKVLMGFFFLFSYLHAQSIGLILFRSGENIGDQFGISVSWAGDVNGDGYGDFIVGANANDDGGTSSGKIYIFFGGDTLTLDSLPDLIAVGSPGDFFGVSVSGTGDLNKDGYDDVIVGAHFNSDSGLRAGKAIIYFGGNPMDTIPDVIMWGEAAKDYFGISVSGGGDFNGDGFPDVIVGAYKADLVVGVDTFEDVGKAYVYFGGTNMDGTPDLVLHGEQAGERFGYSVSFVGDLNNDGYDDLAVGAYSFDAGNTFNIGRVFVFFGGNPPDTLADLVLYGEDELNYFGWSVSGAGDVNHDGFDDLLVGAYGYSGEAGKSYLFFGGNPMDSLSDVEVYIGEDSARFGFSVSGLGYVDNDQFEDFIVGADRGDGNTIDEGKAYIFNGDSTSTSIASPDTTLFGENPLDAFGHSVSSAFDINGDGTYEILVGAYAYNNYRGKVYLYGIPGETAQNVNFVRGDANNDLNLNFMDLVFLANYLFQNGPSPTCMDSGDLNDDGAININDLNYMASFFFGGGPAPPLPFPNCGNDPTADQLNCLSHSCQ